MNGLHLVPLAALVASLASPAFAFSGNVENGKKIFMTKGANGKACMTCHPAGLTTNETFKGKDIPDLVNERFNEAKIQKKTLKFLKYQEMSLSTPELNDLLAFVQQLPDRGFGAVPSTWQAHVKKYVR